MAHIPEGELTKKQLEVVRFAESGHNFCLLGRGGVGKTSVVHTVKKVLTSQGKKCVIVCSSGISCIPYGGTAKTVHSQYGLQTAEFPDGLLLARSLANNTVRTQIASTDVLIWDEISMSSQRIFELLHTVHCSLSGNTLPFGGIQVILVGDFSQFFPIFFTYCQEKECNTM